MCAYTNLERKYITLFTLHKGAIYKPAQLARSLLKFMVVERDNNIGLRENLSKLVRVEKKRYEVSKYATRLAFYEQTTSYKDIPHVLLIVNYWNVEVYASPHRID